MFLKRYYNELITLRNECDSLCNDFLIQIGKDMFSYDVNSNEFKYLKTFYKTLLSQVSICLTSSHRTFSKKKIQSNITRIGEVYSHWNAIAQQLREQIAYEAFKQMDGNGNIDNLNNDIKNTVIQ